MSLGGRRTPSSDHRSRRVSNVGPLPERMRLCLLPIIRRVDASALSRPEQGPRPMFHAAMKSAIEDAHTLALINGLSRQIVHGSGVLVTGRRP